MIDSTDLAWAAGIIEGEGCIRIGAKTKQNHTFLTVSVTNTDREMVDWLQEQWPGFVKPAAGLAPPRRPAWVWTVSTRKAAAFLAQIQPYVKTQRVREKIALALEFQSQKRPGNPYTRGPGYRALQDSYFQRMRVLNQRGTPTK